MNVSQFSFCAVIAMSNTAASSGGSLENNRALSTKQQIGFHPLTEPQIDQCFK